MFQNKLNYKLFNITVFMFLLYIGLSNINLWGSFISRIFSLVLPFVVGFLMAYALNPFVLYLQRKRLPKWLSITIVVGTFLLLFSALIVTVLPLLYEQLVSFSTVLLQVIENIADKFQLNLGSFEAQLLEFLNEIVQNIGVMASTTTVDFIGNFLGFMSQIVIGAVSFLYFLSNMEQLRRGFKNLLLLVGMRLFQYIEEVDYEIFNYIKGLGILMLVQFVEYSFLFFIIGHPNWLILGILAGLLTAIPYLGGFITNLVAILTAFLISKPLFIWSIIICVFFPIVDEYFVSPRIYGKTNDINPLVTIIVLSIGGSLFGMLGIILSIPCYLLIRTTYLFFRRDLKKGLVFMKDTI